ncbi:MAG: hypothetical protein ACW99G_23235 [Candidatus Thorarchaeota archaeon]|jgi:hypothetical protein
MAAFWAMAVVAAVGVVMQYRSSRQAQHRQEDQWEYATETEAERYRLAAEEWQTAVRESEKSYEEDLELYEERRAFYKDIAEDPTDTEVWKTFQRGIEQSYRQGTESLQHQLASRGGMVGGEAEEAFSGLEMSRQRDLATVLSGIITRAEEQYQMEGARKPHWERPAFLQSTNYQTPYGGDIAAPQLDLSGLSSSLYLLGKNWPEGTTTKPGTTTDYDIMAQEYNYDLEGR